MSVYLEHIYDPPQHKGYRVLADRLWPRGMTKERAALDEWCKDIAPSTDLRKWFGHAPEKWAEFGKRYMKELSLAHDEAQELLKRSGKTPLILLTATKDMDHTHLIVLKKYLSGL